MLNYFGVKKELLHIIEEGKNIEDKTNTVKVLNYDIPKEKEERFKYLLELESAIVWFFDHVVKFRDYNEEVEKIFSSYDERYNEIKQIIIAAQNAEINDLVLSHGYLIDKNKQKDFDDECNSLNFQKETKESSEKQVNRIEGDVGPFILSKKEMAAYAERKKLEKKEGMIKERALNQINCNYNEMITKALEIIAQYNLTYEDFKRGSIPEEIIYALFQKQQQKNPNGIITGNQPKRG